MVDRQCELLDVNVLGVLFRCFARFQDSAQLLNNKNSTVDTENNLSLIRSRVSQKKKFTITTKRFDECSLFYKTYVNKYS